MGAVASYCLEWVQLEGGPRDGLACEVSALLDQVAVPWSQCEAPWWAAWLPQRADRRMAVYVRSQRNRLVFEYAMEVDA